MNLTLYRLLQTRYRITKLFVNPRYAKGGGLAVIARKGFDIQKHDTHSFVAFEHLDLTLVILLMLKISGSDSS